MEKLYDVIVVGGGPAGLSAAIYAARAQYRVLVIEKEKIGGQITITSEVVNYPGLIQTDGKKMTESMRIQAENFGADFLIAEVNELSLDQPIKSIKTDKGSFEALGVILATGANPRKIGFTGEQEYQGRGVAYCATCDGEFFTGKDVFVLGGGFAAAEEGMFLTKYAKKVRMIVREPEFTCAKSIADEVLARKDMEVHFNTEITEAYGDEKLKGARFINRNTGKEWDYKPENGDGFGIFVFAGYAPATQLVKDKVELDEFGYVITDINKKTNIDGVYGAGDVCIKNLRQVVTAVSDGAIAATSLEKHIALMYEKLKLEKKDVKKRSVQPIQSEAKNHVNNQATGFITEEMKHQLMPLFDKFEKPVWLKFYIDDQLISKEIEAFAAEILSLTPQINGEVIKKEDITDELIYPAIRFFNDQNQFTGFEFHGVPGGHEFNSFIVTLYNAAGPGQAIDQTILERIKSIRHPVDLKIIVSLSCTMCPDLVMAAGRIALENTNVTAGVFDLMHYPDLKNQYQIMSVPCMIINDQEVIFGKKGIAEILDLLAKMR
ncbi:FAD-dependent oxidoreductase [Acetobacterium sp. K1/6]|jgi:putative alkyl hydroperoxide reductase F subunit|uniref:FAD-dependent oxidoreductase n=1 Tax=Acetobacterium sp. K1/6 TaxID=3055467 RepID=UPI002ACA6B44|nr:FAD-dependent oxidoreductase [Acetobacterium sp. K1/6]MDZ5723794.1 FAD-dependent oxidoreductase [Acetobacterium sp. K1/6]